MPDPVPPPRPSTFSIVPFDPKTKTLGVAVETNAAFESWASINNYENKIRSDGKIWGSVFRAVRAAVDRAGK
ncbi:MAG: putative peptidoglycan binding domain-containing protein [Thermoplasmata archaeon]